jgi:hypothetical protein
MLHNSEYWAAAVDGMNISFDYTNKDKVTSQQAMSRTPDYLNIKKGKN